MKQSAVLLSPFQPLQYLLRDATEQMDLAERTLQILGLNDLSLEVRALRKRISEVDFLVNNGQLQALVPRVENEVHSRLGL
jgi:hypothetical protein